MKCKICNREAEEKYCEFHEEAYRNITRKYDDWQRRLEITWKEYLSEIAKDAYTGSWAKEVAMQLLSDLE